MSDEDELSVVGANTGLPLFDTRAVNADLYVHALNSVYHSYRIWEPSYAGSRDPDIWEKVRRDAVISAAVDQRLHAIAAREWRVMPGGKSDADAEAAAVVEEILQQIPRFLETRFELAQAVFLGSAYAFIGGRRVLDTYAKKTGLWWVPSRLKDMDRRRFRWRSERKPAEDGTNELRTWLEYWSIRREEWVEADAARFVRHTYNDEESRLGYGRGLIEAIYFYHYVKGVVMREGLQGLERWAQGMVVVKIDGLRAASDGKPNATVQTAWIKALKKMRARHALTMSKDDEVDLLNGPGQGHQLVETWLRYVDNAMTRLILGSVRPTGGDMDSGARAAAETESDTTEQLIQFDRLLLDETITRDIIGEIWRHNRAAFSECGLGSAKKPKFSSVQEKRSDPVEASQVIATLLGAGVTLRAEEVYERTGMTPPGPDDDVIEGQAALANPFAGIPGMGGQE